MDRRGPLTAGSKSPSKVEDRGFESRTGHSMGGANAALLPGRAAAVVAAQLDYKVAHGGWLEELGAGQAGSEGRRVIVAFGHGEGESARGPDVFGGACAEGQETTRAFALGIAQAG